MFSNTGPFTQLVKEVLTVSNPSPVPVAFKVKTTAPKQYCVKPVLGRIEANQSVNVQGIYIWKIYFILSFSNLSFCGDHQSF